MRTSQSPIATRTTPSLALSFQRSIHATSSLREKKEEEHEGSFARTDSSVQYEHPEEHELPSSAPVQGRGGLHFKRTLASFSLEGRVGVVTGGARGLGLVMSQAMVISGADVAIVDLNSTFPIGAYNESANPFLQRRRLRSRPLSLWSPSRERTREQNSTFYYESTIDRANQAPGSPRSPPTMPTFPPKNP